MKKINLLIIKWWAKRIILLGIIAMIIIKPERTGQIIGNWINSFFGNIIKPNNMINIELTLIAIILILGYTLIVAYKGKTK